jgi:hypothetical protein
MGISRLTVQEMIQISLPWVTAGDAARAAIERTPLLASLLPQLLDAHASIFALRARAAEDPTIHHISEQLAALDGRHDDLIRGMHGVLTSLSLVCEAPEEILGLRDELFPEGLAHIKMTYRGEAGHAARVLARMDDRFKARLAAVVLHKTNLLELTLEWLRVAKQIGDLEEERAGMCPPEAASPSEIYSARFAWMRVVDALLINAKLAGLAQEIDSLIFSALRSAERDAEVRSRMAVRELGLDKPKT